jgi:hypothetical protein
MVSANAWTAEQGLVFSAIALGFLVYLTLWVSTGYEGDTPAEIVRNFVRDKLGR